MKELSGHILYHYETCPFCLRVRDAMKRLDINMELRNAREENFKEELIQGGGKKQVPCLRIEKDGDATTWMYESDAIVEYLENL